MDMETDGPALEDVNLLKRTVEEEATQVRTEISFVCFQHHDENTYVERIVPIYRGHVIQLSSNRSAWRGHVIRHSESSALVRQVKSYETLKIRDGGYYVFQHGFRCL